MNPFYNKPNPMGNMNNIKNMYNMLVNSKNPRAMFAQMAQQNPQLRPIVQALNQGTDPQQLFRQMCEQKGINPDEFIKNITGNNT